MKRLTLTAVAILVLAATPASANDLNVEVGSVINQNGDCTLVTFDTTGEYDAYFLYGPDGLWATETKYIEKFRLLGAIFGVPGESTSISTSDGTAPLGSGTYSLTIVKGADRASAFVECGDLAYDIALNAALLDGDGNYVGDDVANPATDDKDIVKPKATPRVAPEPFEDVLRVPFVSLGHQPRPI